MDKLLISFSGGETSAYMAKHIKETMNVEIVTIFANTGQESEKTLRFVDLCDKEFKLNVVWVEAVPNEGRKGTTHKVVDFDTADREGAVFESMIKKYGIPNLSWKHCTRELKTRAIDSYLKSIGWMSSADNRITNCHRAIGIRSDEVDRVNPNYIEEKIIYPLAFKHPMTKPMINSFWRDMPFRLGLKGYEGNCKWCWKKSLRKHMTLISESPEIYDFPRKMEKLYSKVGAGVEKGTGCNENGERTFFRGNRKVADLFQMAGSEFDPAPDDATEYDMQLSLLDELDAPNGCGESCEAY